MSYWSFSNSFEQNQLVQSWLLLIVLLRQNVRLFKKIIGYIPQDDVVCPELTVRENILHSARIRLPRSRNNCEIEKHVDNLLSCLRLRHIQHHRVGDTVEPVISGGQRKRVSIGIELAAAPLVLVLDEPTSGLDATSALSIIGLLKALCRLGITVICFLHQPRLEIFQSLDRLLLLADGQEIYFARAFDAIEYFENVGFSIPNQCNPAGILMDIISGQGERYAKPGFKRSSMAISQLINRWNLQRNRGIQFTREGTEDRSIVLDALSRSAAARGAPWIRLAAAAPGVKTFGEEKSVYWREASSGHSRSAYFVGKTLSALFRLVLSALHFTAFYSILATPRMSFGLLLAVNTLYFYCIYGLACCVSVITRRENGPLVAMITWHSKAYFHCHTAPLEYLYDVDSAALWTGYTINQLGLDMIMLLVIGTFYRLLAFAGLIYTNRNLQV
ncbi:hypothetical protein EYC80_010569 [Monilinia laxa]|uniref:ABC transporter domain-containing protein n=1 Tax=Monilinia laxa TaxID=61186 RepID=A0A5N6JQS9_MONLA|nr:hypothetical protein EYC80_010569 [Monilinia laxa]